MRSQNWFSFFSATALPPGTKSLSSNVLRWKPKLVSLHRSPIPKICQSFLSRRFGVCAILQVESNSGLRQISKRTLSLLCFCFQCDAQLLRLGMSGGFRVLFSFVALSGFVGNPFLSRSKFVHARLLTSH